MYCDPEFESLTAEATSSDESVSSVAVGSTRDSHIGLQSLRKYPLDIMARVHRELHCNQWICSSFTSARHTAFLNRVVDVSLSC